MSDKPVIIVGLVVGLVLLSLPIWYGLAAGAGEGPPDVKVPEGHCVEDLHYMKASHMDLLNHWRDAVVRDGEKTYTSKAYGTTYEMSLTRTCLKCHAAVDGGAGVGKPASDADPPASPSGECLEPGRTTFCHQCHDYANVRPTCWQCHVEP